MTAIHILSETDIHEGEAGSDRHTHRYHGQALTHRHAEGSRPHGYFAHIESDYNAEGPLAPQPVAVQQLLTELRFQDSRDHPGGSTLVTSRGHGETHTEFGLADLLELQRQTSARIAALTRTPR